MHGRRVSGFLLAFVLFGSCSCLRSEPVPYPELDNAELVLKIKELEDCAWDADGGLARAEGLERVAAAFEELDRRNQDAQANSCGRVAKLRARLKCATTAGPCTLVEELELRCELTEELTHSDYDERAREYRQAAEKLRSSLPDPKALE